MATPNEQGARLELSLPQLRELYVRRRFAGRLAFVHSDVEERIAAERDRERPVDEGAGSFWAHICRFSVWTRELLLLRGSIGEALLREYAEPMASLDDYSSEHGTPAKGQLLGHGALFQACRADGMNIYRVDTETNPTVIVDNGTESMCFTRSGPCSMSIAKVEERHVLGAIFSTWVYGSQARAVLARDYLCTLISEAVTNLRSGLEQEFDDAAAAHQDGLDVCNPTFVLVLGSRNRLTTSRIPSAIYRGSDFATDKIRLMKPTRIEFPLQLEVDQTPEGILEFVCGEFGSVPHGAMRMICRQVTGNIGSHDVNEQVIFQVSGPQESNPCSVLVISIVHCPDIMPEPLANL